jgi:alkanesulfonate monooxygenase SsuD/methylene tetrahydromethanopterin reductase-like flavin-dependent oxidoreductase (luciferase family)
VVPVSISPPEHLWKADLAERRALLAAIADAGLDGVLYADHVSFRGGAGTEALVLMAALSQLHPTLELHVAVYLLPLRHPVPVARAIATLCELAPGRLSFGVGIGGEDRHEIEVCGVDPRTRGRRCDEALAVLRPLLAGESVTFHGEHVDVTDAVIRPAPDPAVPLLVGGRSDAAVRRAGRFGDGWLATWCSVRRLREALALCDDHAMRAGRGDVPWRHTLQLWIGLDGTREVARRRVATAMEAFYKVPFEAFERYTPYGSPEDVAAFLAPYRDAGVTRFNLTPCAGSVADAVAMSGEVKRLLEGSAPTGRGQG